MSLVLEALRRVEKPDSKAGSVGVAVASYRPARRRKTAVAPLLLGLLAGAGLVFIFAPSPNRVSRGREAESLGARVSVAPAAVPESAVQQFPPAPASPAALESSLPAVPPAPAGEPRAAARPAAAPDQRAPSRRAPAAAPAPTLILQAVSERDSYPIAIISDQLVREGDLIGRVRVLKIGSDSVDVLLENGRTETVRFAPPPPPDPSPSLGSP